MTTVLENIFALNFFLCAYCQIDLLLSDDIANEFHHIMPKAFWPNDKKVNNLKKVIPLCISCHLKARNIQKALIKGNLVPIKEFLELPIHIEKEYL